MVEDDEADEDRGRDIQRTRARGPLGKGRPDTPYLLNPRRLRCFAEWWLGRTLWCPIGPTLLTQ